MKTLKHYRQLQATEFLFVGLIATLSGCSASNNNGSAQNGQVDATGGSNAQASSTTGGATNNAAVTGGATSNTGTGGAGNATGGSQGQGGTTATSNTGTGGTSAAAVGGKTSAGTGKNTGGSSSGGTSTKSTGGTSTGDGGASTGPKSTGGASVGGTGTKTTASKNTGGAGTGGVANAGAKATGGANAGGTSASGGGATSSGDCAFTVTSKLASEGNSKSPTTVGIVTWSVTGTTPTSAKIEFGLDTSYGMTAPVDLKATNYQTPLLGMKPAKTYHYRVVATGSGGSCNSQDYTITTGAKTTSVSISNFSVKSEANRKRGFIVTSYWQGTGSAVPFIIDADGDIVWWYGGGPSGGIARARMSVDGKNMWMVVPALGAGGPVQRVSMDTLDAQTYSSTKASHDICAVSGSTMAYMDYGTSCNGIIEIDPSGTTKKVWDAQGSVPSSGCHGNSLRYSAKEDVYSYSDLQSDVYIVSRAGSVQWKLTSKVSGGNSSWGGKQHGQHLLDSSIMIFANSGSSSNASTAIEYSLDGTLIKKFKSGGYTANLGDVQRLPGGNTLINYGNGHVIQEVDASDNVVLEITGGNSSFGYSEWRESLYDAPTDISE
jgi:hypothetical protein